MSEPRTIDCEQVVRALCEYLDGEVSDEQRRQIDQHLALCRSCFSRAEFERQLRSHIVGLLPEVVPPAFEERIRSLVTQFKRR